jgi:tol-pal system protein YbgF
MLSFTAEASSQSSNEILNRINRLESEMVDLNRHLFSKPERSEKSVNPGTFKKNQTTFSGKSKTSPNTAVYNTVKLQKLETLVRSLKGEAEKLNNRIDKLVSDLDRRLAALETVSASSDKNLNSQKDEKVKVGKNYIKPSKSGVLGYLPDSGIEDQLKKSESKKFATSVGSVPTKKQFRLLPEGDPNKRYKFAFQYLRKREYKRAELALLEFIELHPTDPLAGNAMYWLGKSYYIRGLYDKAADTFVTSYEKYSSNPKAPDSLLSLGFSLVRLNRSEDACLAFGQLLNEFSSLTSSTKQQAIAEIKRIGCKD